MLLNKEKCGCGGNCKCTQTPNTNEGLENSKELLGSFDQTIPVLETKNHEYKIVKEAKKPNLLLS